ncbi:hypothetical protein BS78_K338200 [Paspalum vaginatum]|uniref:Uncharacterized protein n=1 Tax=Paspalum vaginatum TaxID=158149 RepID=A0A9W7XAX6_9POAL|nr:hypothetical protein BS78_K338200 [Paspalum vaginatum]
MKEVQELLDKIDELKNRGLTGMAVAIDFVYHGIQPLKDRVKLACFYSGEDDRTREVNRQVTREEIAIRVRSFFTGRVTNNGAPRSFSVYEPPSEDLLTRYVSEPPYPEELALRSRRSPRAERAVGSPAGTPAGEMLADFYAEVGSEDRMVKDVPALSESASEGMSCRTTRQTVRKRKAATALEAPKVAVLPDEDEVESDGETLDQRKRRISASPSEAGRALVSTGASAKPVIRIVKPKIRLPSASKVISQVAPTTKEVPPPRLETCRAAAGTLSAAGGEKRHQPASESSTRDEEASCSKVVVPESGPVATEPQGKASDAGADDPGTAVESLGKAPELAEGVPVEGRELTASGPVSLLMARASAGSSLMGSVEMPECVRGVFDIYAKNMRLRQEMKAAEEKYKEDEAKAAQSLRIIKAQNQELTELQLAKNAAESEALTLKAQLTNQKATYEARLVEEETSREEELKKLKAENSELVEQHAKDLEDLGR